MSRRAGVAAAALCIAAAAPWWLGASELLIATMGLAYAVAALGLVVLTGWSGQVSLAQASFMGVGAFVAARLLDATVGMPLWGAVPIAMGAAALTSLVVGAAAIRLRGVHLAVVTLGFAQVLQSAVFGNRTLTGGGNGLRVARPSFGAFDMSSDRTTYFVVLGVALAACLAVVLLWRSDTGRRFAALRAPVAVVSARGVDVVSTTLLAFAWSAALAGLGGCMLALALQSVGPASFNPLQSIVLLAVVVVVARRSVMGAVVAGMLVAAMPSILARLLTDVVGASATNLVVGAALLAAVLVRERGRVPGVRHGAA